MESLLSRRFPFLPRLASASTRRPPRASSRSGGLSRGPSGSHVVVVGGGLAAAGIASSLSRLAPNATVTILDAGRTVGGRTASLTPREFTFDHGTQYISAKPNCPLTNDIAPLVDANFADYWDDTRVGALSTLDLDSFTPLQNKQLLVGVPSNTAIVHGLLATHAPHATVENSSTVVELVRRDDETWRVLVRVREGGHVWYRPMNADVVLLAVPAGRAVKLLRDAGAEHLADVAANVKYTKSLALVVAFDQTLGLPFNGATLPPEARGLAWVGNDSSKPGRTRADGAECWVAHATPEWSDVHSGADPSEVGAEMLDAFRAVLRIHSEMSTAHCRAFEWGAAFPINAVDSPTFDAAWALGVAGDWTAGPRAADAYRSGLQLGSLAAEHLE